MIQQGRIKYIQKNLRSGYVDVIKKKLLSKGYSETDIDDTISYVKGQNNSKETPMAVSATAKIQYAGFWVRFSAMVWDWIIFGIPVSIIQILLIWSTGIDSMAYVATLGMLVLTVYMDGIKGGTPGKLILGLTKA